MKATEETKSQAKAKGISNYWSKSEETLLEELSVVVEEVVEGDDTDEDAEVRKVIEGFSKDVIKSEPKVEINGDDELKLMKLMMEHKVSFKEAKFSIDMLAQNSPFWKFKTYLKAK